jgi:hypothetical protein
MGVRNMLQNMPEHDDLKALVPRKPIKIRDNTLADQLLGSCTRRCTRLHAMYSVAFVSEKAQKVACATAKVQDVAGRMQAMD